jgi:hypothetical protein
MTHLKSTVILKRIAPVILKRIAPVIPEMQIALSGISQITKPCHGIDSSNRLDYYEFWCKFEKGG